jgi:amidase
VVPPLMAGALQLSDEARIDTYRAFTEHGRVQVAGSGVGPLAGMRFAVKDQFDVAGFPTGLGNPSWLETSPVPSVTAEPVQRLLDAGGVMVGKTHMDEFGWSLNGINHHYGTPINAAAPTRTPGGSSSGSAAAVAGGVVPFALCGDGGGSIRVPASYCGIYGIRPTVGRLGARSGPEDLGLATAGWLAADVRILELVGSVLLDRVAPAPRPTRLIYAEDLFGALDPGVAEAMQVGVRRIASVGPGELSPVTVAGTELPKWRESYKLLQAGQFRRGFGAWVRSVRPELGPDIAERFAWSETLTDDDLDWAAGQRRTAVDRMRRLLPEGTVLVAPSAPGIAPLRSAGMDELEERRAKAFLINVPTGLAGLPQVSLPLAHLDGCPLGVSMIAAPGGDEMLLSFTRQVAAAS